MISLAPIAAISIATLLVPGDEPGKPPPPDEKAAGTEARLRDAREKIEAGAYAEAKALIEGGLKEPPAPEGRKRLEALLEEARFGLEIDGARDLILKKEERRAIAKLEKALAAHPDSPLRPLAEKALGEAEELAYLILDDFEREEERSPEASPAKAKAAKRKAARKARPPAPDEFHNDDPRFVRHGKGSLRWELRAGETRRGLQDPSTWQAPALGRSIAKWRHLVFWIHLPEVGKGALQVVLAPKKGAKAGGPTLLERPVDLGGKKGWIEVRLDLRRDFAWRGEKDFEEVRGIAIRTAAAGSRRVYLDFVHLE